MQIKNAEVKKLELINEKKKKDLYLIKCDICELFMGHAEGDINVCYFYCYNCIEAPLISNNE